MIKRITKPEARKLLGDALRKKSVLNDFRKAKYVFVGNKSEVDKVQSKNNPYRKTMQSVLMKASLDLVDHSKQTGLRYLHRVIEVNDKDVILVG